MMGGREDSRLAGWENGRVRGWEDGSMGGWEMGGFEAGTMGGTFQFFIGFPYDILILPVVSSLLSWQYLQGVAVGTPLEK